MAFRRHVRPPKGHVDAPGVLWTIGTTGRPAPLASLQEVAAVRYEVGPDGLRQRSEHLSQASARVARLQVGEAVSALRLALPGSSSADAAGQLAREWDDMLCTWTRGATDHARFLRRAAGDYDLVEVLNRPRSWTNPLKRGA
jgi:hypothetical protein